MVHVVLFHSILGLRSAEREIAAAIEADGHIVSLPDLFGGQTTEAYEDGFVLKEAVGDKLIRKRALEALKIAPTTAVLAGVSFGAFLVGQLSASRPDMKGALLFAGVAPWAKPPKAGLPVQAHIAQPDPFDDEVFFEGWLADEMTACDMFRYKGVGHYFLDRNLLDYDADAAETCLGRVQSFLRDL
ncbi:dienelactone hydrolase family protein [Roseibium sp. HPY-6]|uniref:dienelactone hydrolase family protein n=1 Tax=Roseibium sp. HPY-6 TaxID=3229852 RepID=UPI00338E47B9